MSRQQGLVAVIALGAGLFGALPGNVLAQTPGSFTRYEAVLRHEHPQTHALLLRLEHAQAVLFDGLAAEGEAVRASAAAAPRPGFEPEMLRRLGTITGDGDVPGETVVPRDARTAIGERAAAVIEWTNEFRREVLGILADPGLVDVQARQAALTDAVALYRSRPEASLPMRPKNMDILYFHDQALDFRSGYPDLGGMAWAGDWLRLAVVKPLLDLAGAERVAGLDTVQARYHAKLSYGEPPASFPSELPLSPAIIPELAFLSPETTAIWDNLSMMQEVLADILVSPNVDDEHAAIEKAVTFFLDPEVAVTDPVEFGAMALRHGIFNQGGYPLAVMTRSERNADGHAAHLRSGRMTLPGM